MNDRSLDGQAATPSGTPTRFTEGSAKWRAELCAGSSREPLHTIRFLTSPIHDFIATLFPALCLVCDEPLLRSGRVPVCERCLAAAPKPPSGLCCATCGDALGYENERIMLGLARPEQRCTPCRLVPPEFRRAVAAAIYDGPTRELLHLLKYDGVRSLGGPLGAMLADAIEQLVPEFDAEVETLLVPVPLFRARRRERGFNQAALLMEAARGELRRRYPKLRLRGAAELLERTRATESQFALNPAQRRRNLRGAFVVSRPEVAAGRDVVLIDDIYTTGATARACALALRQAGARTICVATIARAQPETVAMWDGGHGAGTGVGQGFGDAAIWDGGAT